MLDAHGEGNIVPGVILKMERLWKGDWEKPHPGPFGAISVIIIESMKCAGSAG